LLHGPAIDQALASEDALGDILWPLADHLGSVRDIIDSDGNVENHILYNSFGEVVSETDSALGYLFGFTGRERDVESDLQFNRARYYDAAVGRWISEDPIGFAAGDTNLNRYVGNGPVDKVDPWGLQDPTGGIYHDYTQGMTGNPSPFKKDKMIPKFAREENLAWWWPGDWPGIARNWTRALEHKKKRLDRAAELDQLSEHFREIQLEGSEDAMLMARGLIELGMTASEIILLAGMGPLIQAKGTKFFTKHPTGIPSTRTVTKIDKFIVFKVDVPGNSPGSYTRWVKTVNSDGKTIQLYHDTFDKHHKFISRGIKVPLPERHAP
jgi:RHS repeat-associated protein